MDLTVDTGWTDHMKGQQFLVTDKIVVRRPMAKTR